MSPRWMGRCPGCGSYNTMVEEASPRLGRTEPGAAARTRPVRLREVPLDSVVRRSTGSAEVDRVLGGGIVPGALMLLGGDPGIGKSTLMLQIAAHVSRTAPVLYVSAEESLAQTRLRMERLVAEVPDGVHLLADGRLDELEAAWRLAPWGLVVVDSLQTVYDPEGDSAPGSVSQVRDVASHLLRWSKADEVPVFLVGHVNKEGSRRPPAVGNIAA